MKKLLVIFLIVGMFSPSTGWAADDKAPHAAISHPRLAAETQSGVEVSVVKSKAPVGIEFKHSVIGGQLKVRYSITNRSGKPIFVFDRMLKDDSLNIDQNWVYVALSNMTAVFRRWMELMPQGVHMETPAEPYAREVAAGAVATGSFKVHLPLKEGGPYDRQLGRKLDQTVSVDNIAVEIGWCPKSDLESGLEQLEPVKSNEGPLWLFGYGQLKGLQKTAVSEPAPARLRALSLTSI